VRGEFEQLYPGDGVAGWIGVPVFAHELCPPIYDNGYQYNGGYDTGLEPSRGDLWVRRLFGLMGYHGPIPNTAGTFDLSHVIKAVAYIDLDFRYGWDGLDDGSFDFPVSWRFELATTLIVREGTRAL
jgi:hypothetical protein